MSKAKPPAGLGASVEFWDQVTSSYDLRIDELRVLADICREMDLIDLMQAEVDSPTFNLRARGSMGQEVADPIIQELRQHRALIARLLAQLKLPEDATAGKTSAAAGRSRSARAAAEARWRGSAASR